MDLHTVKIAAEYGSLSLYGIGILAFFIFGALSLKPNFKHFFVTALVSLIWPIFIVIILLRQKPNRK